METPVHVMSQEEFDAWVQSQTTPLSDDPVVRGDLWAQQYGCRACHSIDGTVVVGPTWKGLYGTQEALEDGSSILVDHDYLFESIRTPSARITAGYQNLMPANIAEKMTDDQLEDVAAFIVSLK
jgi:cytochrome c oxidase subunit 2